MKRGSRSLGDRMLNLLNSTDWREWFEEKEPGVLVWKKLKDNDHRNSVGDVAGWIETHGYCKIGFGGDYFFRHHIVWILHNGPIPKGMVINHLRSSSAGDSIDNLELVTPDENNSARKIVKTSSRNTFGSRGVRQRENGTWQARVMVDGKHVSLGHFSTREEAEAAHKSFIETGELPRKKLNRNCRSFVPGIQLLPNGKFKVENNKGGKRNYIGTFNDFESAASALIEWEVMNGY